MSETQYARIITKASTGVPTIPPSADHSNGDWVSTDIYEHELYLDDATGKIYTNIGGVITDLAPTSPDTNIYNTDGTLTGNRLVDMDGNILQIDNGQFVIGNTMGSPYLMEVNGTGESKRGLTVESSGLVAILGTDASNVAVWGNSSGSIGLYGTTATGFGLNASASSTGWAARMDGKTLVQEFGGGGVQAASSLMEVQSTTRGFLVPRMTTTQRDAIAAPATGLEIYNTTTNRKEWYNGTYWQGEAYSVNLQANQSSPTASTTTYWGHLALQPSATAAIRKIYIRRSGVIRIAEIYSRANTAGDADNWSLYVRLNNTTDYLIQTVGVSASERVWSNTNINIPVVSGDYVEIKMVNPAWATAPANITFGGYLLIE
jgi:hypothetical protein